MRNLIAALVSSLLCFSPVSSFVASSPAPSRVSAGRANTQRIWMTTSTLPEETTAEEQEEEVDDSNKFGFGQRIESIKTAIVGLVSGGIYLTPFSLVHNTLFPGGHVQNGFAQWEFDTDMGSLEAALFAIVYRYCIREDKNEQLKEGVLNAFVLVRTLSKIQVPAYCSAAPLDCGDPIGYFDWDMIYQAGWSGVESVVVFGGAAKGLEYCFQKGWIGKFPG